MEAVLMEAKTMGNYLIYDLVDKEFGTDINGMADYFFGGGNQMLWPADDMTLICLLYTSAVGITFAFLNYPIVKCITIIGLTTFVLSIVGVVVGNMFGSRYQKKAEIAGGIILILIGLKILLEHLGILVL